MDHVEGIWHRTEAVVNRLQDKLLYEEPDASSREGYFAGRHIIARDTPINKGVYLGSSPRDAIVVDDEKYPQELGESYAELCKWFEFERFQGNIKNGDHLLFEKVLEMTKQRLGGDDPDIIEKVDSEIRRVRELEWTKNGRLMSGDIKIPLNLFIKKGVGVCRHRALLAGYLLERMVNYGQIFGSVSIDRNTIKGKGGHAWVRFTDGKDIIIIDPSLGYVGKLQDASVAVWDYRRPEDIYEHMNTEPSTITTH